MRGRYLFELGVAAVACAVALAACGSSGNASTAAAQSADAPGVRLADCMRAHGVPSFPDATSGEPVGQQIVAAGVNPLSPAFVSAISACKTLVVADKESDAGARFAQRKVELSKLAECMRAHGLSTFPDPTTGSSPPVGGSGISFSGPNGSVSLSVPESLLQSPAFRRTAGICGFPLPGAAKQQPAG